MSDTIVFEGWLSVEATLAGGNREVHAVYLRADKHWRDTARIEQRARAAGVPVERKDASFFDEHAQGTTHGGVLAEVGPRRFQTLEELLPKGGPAFVVMLDGIEDPYNFGHAVRALYAAGVDGIVVRSRDWSAMAGVIARSSAGASELVPMARAESALEAAEFFGGRGLVIACTARREAVAIYEADLTGPLFLLIGGERRGITRSFMDRADLVLRVPYGRSFGASLTTASVSAVIAFEVARQRSCSPPTVE